MGRMFTEAGTLAQELRWARREIDRLAAERDRLRKGLDQIVAAPLETTLTEVKRLARYALATPALEPRDSSA